MGLYVVSSIVTYFEALLARSRDSGIVTIYVPSTFKEPDPDFRIWGAGCGV